MWHVVVVDMNANETGSLVTKAAMQQFPRNNQPLMHTEGCVRDGIQLLATLPNQIKPDDKIIVIAGFTFVHGSGLDVLRAAHRELSAGMVPDRVTLILHTAEPQSHPDIATFLRAYPKARFIPKNSATHANLSDLFWQVQHRKDE